MLYAPAGSNSVWSHRRKWHQDIYEILEQDLAARMPIQYIWWPNTGIPYDTDWALWKRALRKLCRITNTLTFSLGDWTPESASQQPWTFFYIRARDYIVEKVELGWLVYRRHHLRGRPIPPYVSSQDIYYEQLYPSWCDVQYTVKKEASDWEELKVLSIYHHQCDIKHSRDT